MARLIDSNLWIDLARPKTPPAVKQYIKGIIWSAETALAEPVMFEVLAFASEKQVARVRDYLNEFKVLPTPIDIWSRATDLGRKGTAQGEPAGHMDLLIAAVALYNDAEVVTFDIGMAAIANFSKLRVRLLTRPTET